MADFKIFRYSHLMKSPSDKLQRVGLCVTRLLKVTALPVAVVLGHSASWGSDTSSAALRVLLGSTETSQQTSSPAALHATDGSQRRTITVMRGESLDRVIRRALPGIPLHPDFLRQAFVRVNPEVFPKGAVHAMRTGTTLQVPTTHELRFLLMSHHPETVNLFQLVETTKASDPEPNHVRRQWVRFP